MKSLEFLVFVLHEPDIVGRYGELIVMAPFSSY